MENPGFRIFMEGATMCYENEVDSTPGSILDSLGIFCPDTFEDPSNPGSGGSGSGSGSSEDVTEYMITYLDGVGYYTYSSGWITEETIGPLLSTAWHQRSPYNYYCPTENGELCAAGCVPIAISQIMAYHKYPPVVNGYSIDWTLVESGAMEDSLHYAARVVREVGREANADYGTKVTTATNSEAKQALRAFGYSVSSYETYSDVRVKLYLGLQRPILARGDNVDGGVGHMWVIDGYLKNKNVNYYYNM